MRTDRVCLGATTHTPVYMETDNHHIYPLFLARLLGVLERTEKVVLCSGCHDNVHHLIRHFLLDGHYGGHRASPRTMALAKRAADWYNSQAGGELVTSGELLRALNDNQ